MIGAGKYLKLVLTCALGGMVSPCMADTADVDTASRPVTVSSAAVVKVHYSTNTLRGTKSGLLTKAGGGLVSRNRKPATLAEALELAEAEKDGEAIRVCDELIRKGGFDSKQALRLKGHCLHRLKRYADACLCWEVMLTGSIEQSKNDDILLKLASTYAFNLNEPEKAEKHYQRLLRTWSPSKFKADAQYQYAGIRYVAKDYTNAVTLFQDHLREFPDSVYAEKAQEYLGLCEKAIEKQETAAMQAKVAAAEAPPPPPPPDQKSRAQQEFEAGEALFASKLYKEALKSYQAVKNDVFCRERDAAVYRMGQCYSELGKDEDAIRQWEESARPSPRSTNTLYAVQSLKAIGDTYFDKLAETDPAIKAYRKLVANYPHDALIPSVMEKIGIIYLYQGKMQEAKPIFEQLQPATPPDPNEPPTGLDRLIALCDGRAALQLPDIKQTARDNQAAVALRKGDIFFTAKRYEEALHAYKKAEALGNRSEDSARALMQAGRCCRQLDEYRKAESCYDRFLMTYRQSPLADDVLMRLAALKCVLEDREGMADCYKRLLKDYPDGDTAWQAQLSLATLSYWDRDWHKALKLHEEFVQKFPNSPSIELVVSQRLPEIKAALGAKKPPQVVNKKG